MKLHAKSSRNDQALKILNQMCDVELILRLFCILPLLECVHMIIKVTQGQDFFYVILWSMWNLCNTSFIGYIVILTRDSMILHLTTSMQLKLLIMKTFPWVGFLISMAERMPCIWHFHVLDTSTLFTSMTYMVLENFNLSPKKLSNWLWPKSNNKFVKGFIKELEWHFPKHQVIIALGVVYPQFQARNLMDVKEEFHRQLNVLKATFYAFWKVGEIGKVVCTLLSSHNPDLQVFFSRWPWDKTLNQFCMRKVIPIHLPSFIIKILDLHFSTISSQNSLSLLKFLLFKSLVPLKMNRHLTCVVSWKKIPNQLNTHLNMCTRFHN